MAYEGKLVIDADTHVYEPADLLPAAEALAKKIAANAPLAVQAAKRAIDGNTSGHYFEAKSTTHTEISDDPWWAWWVSPSSAARWAMPSCTA